MCDPTLGIYDHSDKLQIYIRAYKVWNTGLVSYESPASLITTLRVSMTFHNMYYNYSNRQVIHKRWYLCGVRTMRIYCRQGGKRLGVQTRATQNESIYRDDNARTRAMV